MTHQSIVRRSAGLLVAIGLTLFFKLGWITSSFDTSPLPSNRASWTATLSALIWIAAILPWVRPSARVPVALLADAVLTSVAFLDRLHWRFVGDVSSLSELRQAWQLWMVAPSIRSLVRPADALLYFDVALGLVCWLRMTPAPDSRPAPVPTRAWQSATACAFAIALAIPALRSS